MREYKKEIAEPGVRELAGEKDDLLRAWEDTRARTARPRKCGAAGLHDLPYLGDVLL